jgi:hypothetical protein
MTVTSRNTPKKTNILVPFSTVKYHLILLLYPPPVNSSSDMVQYHALSLLYKIKQHDRLAVSKIVQQLSKGN